MPRMVVLVIDSGGVGALPDADAYGDTASVNTLGNVAAHVGGLHLPTFEQLGLGDITPIVGVAKVEHPRAAVARLRERSRGKDTITGHWEMAGIITDVPFPTYPDGFPPDVIERFTEIVGKAPLGNKPASGTEIIAELGDEHVRTGRPILYTSADSVFQVAVHEDVVPLSTLYDWCERARAMLLPPNNVNRVIARPFIGTSGNYSRTPNRRDYAIEPPPSVLDTLAAANVPVHAVGKICDIYTGHGIATSVRVVDNDDAMNQTASLLEKIEHGLVFTNLNDFDSKYGHRRDVRGYARALEQLDVRLAELTPKLRAGDGLIVTADHGCDPTAPGSDHTREFVPYIELGTALGGELGTLEGLDQIGKRLSSVLLHKKVAGSGRR
ncbi:MAG TPA: phosphopentomutase [Candidatus Baltobacteraceae bacterium]